MTLHDDTALFLRGMLCVPPKPPEVSLIHQQLTDAEDALLRIIQSIEHDRHSAPLTMEICSKVIQQMVEMIKESVR